MNFSIRAPVFWPSTTNRLPDSYKGTPWTKSRQADLADKDNRFKIVYKEVTVLISFIGYLNGLQKQKRDRGLFYAETVYNMLGLIKIEIQYSLSKLNYI